MPPNVWKLSLVCTLTEPVSPSPFDADLQELMSLTDPRVWDAFRSQAIFLSGGTGFIGRWLVEALLHADRELGLGLMLTVLSRDPAGFLARCPHLNRWVLRLHAGDVTRFSFPQGEYAFAVHAALPVTGPGQASLLEAGLKGSQRMAEFARQAGTQRLLHISSGAVYGSGAGSHGPICENDAWDLATPPNDYTLAKRTEELVLASALPGRVVTARCFAFMGPGFSADAGTAAAQFIAQAARGEPISIGSDGSAVRSYQYTSDMARWLISLLALGPGGNAFNVGSDAGVSIRDLATRIHRGAGITTDPIVASGSVTGRAGHIYVPSVVRASQELGLANHVALDEAIVRSLRAARATGTNIASK